MILAKVDTPCNDWEYTDAIRNHLYSLLDNTIYDTSKKKRYEYLIQGELSQEEYESLTGQLLRDAKNPVTQGGNYKQGDIVRHLRKLK